MPYTIIGGIGEMELMDEASMANPMAMLTLDNQVCFGGDATLENYSAGNPFAILPNETFHPSVDLYIPVCVTSENAIQVTYLMVSTGGDMSLPADYANATLHLAGITFTVNSTYYTPEIGNIYDNGTSPLSTT